MELKQKKQEKAKKLRGDHCHSIGVTSPIRYSTFELGLFGLRVIDDDEGAGRTFPQLKPKPTTTFPICGRKNHSCIASTFPSNRILSVARETVCINDIARLESVLTIGSLISLSKHCPY
ncbi:hypothetical protein PGT21_029257 [Puccinia graminis f. sp. tritici]|uniref:Uncharacterized protein n=1 Tax=Puccinia graminis f. sp. tritici TaxID=56615 RepID=A0A5B0NPN4_PUCGR|nr:hypothetical protein PGTUg99_025771 [Puccinia graminis f. sp. tritici]KAA1091235.1 hypothetical protein PGT21_029257 [Puccinia graminis f. sp. tritici]